MVGRFSLLRLLRHTVTHVLASNDTHPSSYRSVEQKSNAGLAGLTSRRPRGCIPFWSRAPGGEAVSSPCPASRSHAHSWAPGSLPPFSKPSKTGSSSPPSATLLSWFGPLLSETHLKNAASPPHSTDNDRPPHFHLQL